MIQLPESATSALLGLALGLLLGVLAGRWLFHSEPVPTLPDWEGTFALERDRPLAPEDTAGQAEPDVEIRYRTRTDTILDTAYVPVPRDFTSDPVLSTRTPLQLTPHRVTHTYWDPSGQRFEQRAYDIPEDRYQLSIYAVGLSRFQPRPTYQAGVGLEAYLDPKWLPGAIEPFGEVRAGRQVVASMGLRWHLVQL